LYKNKLQNITSDMFVDTTELTQSS